MHRTIKVADDIPQSTVPAHLTDVLSPLSLCSLETYRPKLDKYEVLRAYQRT